VGHPYDIPQHRTMDERAKAAQLFRAKFGIRGDIYVAPVGGSFEANYKPWPFRFFVIEKGRVVVSPKPVGEVYNIGELWDYLNMKKCT